MYLINLKKKTSPRVLQIMFLIIQVYLYIYLIVSNTLFKFILPIMRRDQSFYRNDRFHYFKTYFKVKLNRSTYIIGQHFTVGWREKSEKKAFITLRTSDFAEFC